MNAHVIQSQIKEVCLKTAWHARPQTRTQDVYPELQNFVLEKFCTVLLKILLSLRDSTHLILEQTQVNVREGHNAVRLKQRANDITEKRVYLFVYILAYKR